MNILIQFTRANTYVFYARLNLSSTVHIIYCLIAYATCSVYSLKAKNRFDPGESISVEEGATTLFLLLLARNEHDTRLFLFSQRMQYPLKIAVVSASVSDTITHRETAGQDDSADATPTPRIYVRADTHDTAAVLYAYTTYARVHTCVPVYVCVYIYLV